MELAVLGGVIVGVWLFLLWLGISIWTFRDIRERSQDVTTQTLSVFLVVVFFPSFNLPGLMLYLILRPKETMEETYARALEEEALLRDIGEDSACPSCRRFVESAFVVCPYCQVQLKENCLNCGIALSFTWIACPYCGTGKRAQAPAIRAAAARRQRASPLQDLDLELARNETGADEASINQRRRPARPQPAIENVPNYEP